VKENKSEIKQVGKFVYDNRVKVFQGVSNAQRFVEKNMRGNKNPIRYLQAGEIHVPLHNFTGPGTKVDQAAVRNHEPYNEIDACSKVHDLEFNRLFKMPLGRERSEGIRKADREALECYARHKNADGYRLAAGGINAKIALEDLSPTIFDKIMGETYRGVEPALKAPKKKCKGSRNRKKCEQRGGVLAGELLVDNIMSGVAALPYLATPLALGVMYGEYRLGKSLYDRFAGNDQAVEPAT
jgi:hypothetical protein